MSAADPAPVKAVEAFLGCFQIEEIGDAVARRAAALRAERKGLTLADAFVLATAQLGGRILVTRNIKVFPASMPGIRVPSTLRSEARRVGKAGVSPCKSRWGPSP